MSKLITSLIYNWCCIKDRYGLTLPYLIGAIRLKSKNDEYSIENFFNELPLTEIDVLISFCSDIDEIVIGTFKNNNAPKKFYDKINSIYMIKKELNIETYHQLKNLFIKKYSGKVLNNNYSKNYYNGEWNPFDYEDIEFINTIEE